jgi:hypothetical protein
MDGGVGLYSFSFVSPFHACLSSLHFLLSDVSITVVSPDGTRPKLAPLSVSPSLIGDISNSPASVVIRHLHDLVILLGDLDLKFTLEHLIILHLIQSPRRTNRQNVVAFFLALGLVVLVGDHACFKSINAAGAVTREILQRKSR